MKLDEAWRSSSSVARTLAALAVLAACAPVLAGCLSADAAHDFAPIASADWRPGYTFRYVGEATGTSHLHALKNGAVQPGSGDADAGYPVPPLALEVLSTQVPDGAQPMYLTATQYGGMLNALTTHSRIAGRLPIGIRQTDLQPVDTKVHYRQACADLCTTHAVDLRYQDAPTYPWVQFPLQRGKNWSGPLPEAQSPDPLVGPLVVQSMVGGLETVETPLGHVEAVRVDHTITAPQLAARAKQLLSDGSAGHVTDLSSEASLTFTRTIHYGPAQHAVVLDEGLLQLHEALKWTDGGDRYELQLSFDLQTRQSLVAVRLNEVGDLDLPATLDAISPGSNPEAPPLVPPEQPPSGDAPMLHLRAEATAFNAAVEPTVRFHVDSSTPLGPADHLHLSVQGPRGLEAVASEGGVLTSTLHDMGVYTATVLDTAAGQVRARDSIQFVLPYDADKELGCPVPGTATSCQRIPVPVRTGIASLAVDATRPGDLVPARLRLTDSSGHSTTVDFDGGEAHMTLTHFDSGAANGNDWTLAYEPTVATGEKVQLHIHLEPGALGASSAGPPGTTPTRHADTGWASLRHVESAVSATLLWRPPVAAPA